MAKAISMPPQAMNGMAKETPVSKCLRRFVSNSSIQVWSPKALARHCNRFIPFDKSALAVCGLSDASYEADRHRVLQFG